MSIDLRDPRLREIIDPAAAIETLGDDFQFTEGPIWHPHAKHVTFSDIPANKLFRWSQVHGFAVYRDPSNMTNGNTYDGLGRMLSCEHATSRVVREEAGAYQTLASHYQGKELNSPNDIIVGRDGAIYFTDPTYGRQAHTGVVRPQALDFQGVYRIAPDSLELQLLAADFGQPNGLCFDLAQTALYVADTTNRHIRKFILSTDGALSGGDVFASSPAPDGLKTDSLGHVYTGGPGGVHVYHKDDGALLGVIGTPGFCANFCWGGEDLRTLFLTASTGFFRTRVNVPGLALF